MNWLNGVASAKNISSKQGFFDSSLDILIAILPYVIISSLLHNSDFNNPEKEALWKHCREKAVNQHFLLLQQCFLPFQTQKS